MNTLFLNLDEDGMLALWRRLGHYDLPRTLCAVESEDGIDMDALLRLRIRRWYAHLLATGPLEWLPVRDVAAEAALGVSGDGVVELTLPPECVRLVEVRLRGWQRAVTEVHEPGDAEARRQALPLLRGGVWHPVAVRADNRYMLYSLPAGVVPVADTVRCVVADDGRYIFHPDALPAPEQM